MLVTKANKVDKVVIVKRKFPFQQYFKSSAFGIFHNKNPLRRLLFKIMIDPDFVFPDADFKEVELEDMDPNSKREMLNKGFKRDVNILHRTSDFLTVKWEGKDPNNPGHMIQMRN